MLLLLEFDSPGRFSNHSKNPGPGSHQCIGRMRPPSALSEDKGLPVFVLPAKFWFSTLQSREAEYLAIALYLMLSIPLREEGSHESVDLPIRGLIRLRDLDQIGSRRNMRKLDPVRRLNGFSCATLGESFERAFCDGQVR
jgi:Domain of unknown function (DUF6766)